MALRATDTRHQVFSTIHSANASQTIERIIAMFPLVERQLMLQQLASPIEATIRRRLVATGAGGRRPGAEILWASASPRDAPSNTSLTNWRNASRRVTRTC